MQFAHRFLLACAALSASLGLVACGGSGDDPLASAERDDSVTPFLGHWIGCWVTSPNTTEKDDLRVTSTGGNRVEVTRFYNQYTGSKDCTGQPILLLEERSVLTLKGETINVAGVTLEKFDRTGQVTAYSYDSQGVQSSKTDPAPAKATVGVVSGTPDTLRVGDDAQLDPQGNPTALSPLVYGKQP